MTTIAGIYSLIKQTEMNDWVGGSDPEAVGDACFGILDRYIAVNKDSKLLDFGCGIGRVLLSALKHRPNLGHVTGFDIMPQVIDFCNSAIRPSFANTSFQLIGGSNDHYDQFIRAAGSNAALSNDRVVSQYANTFTGAYAFSVFTHVELVDFRGLLQLLEQLLLPGGELLITAFLLTPYSRESINKRLSLFPFDKDAYEQDEQVFIGNTNDRLGFIAFDLTLVEKMVFDAGLVITHIEHGAWTGSGFSSSLQDVIVCRKPNLKTGAVQHVPTVARPPR
jgi:SAM-dependent methyltransferase